MASRASLTTLFILEKIYNSVKYVAFEASKLVNYSTSPKQMIMAKLSI